MLMGDFNIGPNKPKAKTFMDKEHDLYNLIKNKTCYKSPNGTCIANTNKQNITKSNTFETGPVIFTN